MKQNVLLFFTILYIISSNIVCAQSDFQVGDIYYKITSDTTVQVTYSGANAAAVQEYSGNVTVPATVTNGEKTYNVTAVGASAFQYNSGLTSVSLPAGITYLGNRAFAECNALENVTLPEGLISMGGCCFQFDGSLASITIPNSVIALWDDNNDGVNDREGATFMGCKGLKIVTIGSGIKNMNAPNGLFNTAGDMGELEKITCYAATPPVADENTFAIYHYNTPLFVPAGRVNIYAGTSYWWDFATAEQNGESYGAGIYEIGICMPPKNFRATSLTGSLVWTGYAEAYNIIVSETELNADQLAAYTGTVLRTAETEYNLSTILEKENITYYVYLQSDCGGGEKSEWISTSFYYNTNSTCEWTVFGGDYHLYVDPENPNYGFGMNWDAIGLEFWQGDILIAEVKGAVSLTRPTVTLIDGIPVTIEWIGNGSGYNNPNSVYITDGNGNTVINATVKDITSETLGTFNVDCSGEGPEAIEKPITGKIIVAPALSNGFVTVSGAAAGSKVKVIDSRGRILKSETVADGKRIELNYTNGLYFIVVQNGKNIITEKVILKNY